MKLRTAIFYYLVLALLGSLAGFSYMRNLTHQFEIEMTPSSDGDLIVFYDIGNGFRDNDSNMVQNLKGDRRYHLRIPIPWDYSFPPLKLHLRGLNPEVSVASIRLVTRNLLFSRTEENPQIFALSGVTRIQIEEGVQTWEIDELGFILINGQPLNPFLSVLRDEKLWLGPLIGSIIFLLLGLFAKRFIRVLERKPVTV